MHNHYSLFTVSSFLSLIIVDVYLLHILADVQMLSLALVTGHSLFREGSISTYLEHSCILVFGTKCHGIIPLSQNIHRGEI